MSVKRIQNFLENKRKEWYEEDQDLWDEVVYDHDDVNVRNAEERHRYIKECLGQMRDASAVIDDLMGEYNMVTAYLTDAEEIDQLPKSEISHLREICRGMDNLSNERENYESRTCQMSDGEFNALKKRESEVEDGIKKLDEAEAYRVLIKKDLKKLDNEKNAYRYRQKELMSEQDNLKGMVMIVLIALAVCYVILLILQFGFNFEARLGFLISGLAGAAALVFAYVRYTEGSKELARVNNGLNRLITLKNTVKIRFVNNTALLDYLYMKYQVKDSKQLKKQWEKYKNEKEERLKYSHTEAELEYVRKQLLKELDRYNLKYPERWFDQTSAIMDPKEMVELRHGLILQRQALRKQLDYNKEIAASAKDEVMDIARNYPEYTAEIKSMVDSYEKL